MPATVDQNLTSVRRELDAAVEAATSASVWMRGRSEWPDLSRHGHGSGDVLRGYVYAAIDALQRALDDLRVIEE